MGVLGISTAPKPKGVYQEENYEGPASLSSCSHLTWGLGPCGPAWASVVQHVPLLDLYWAQAGAM
jgi:hypothetical protein